MLYQWRILHTWLHNQINGWPLINKTAVVRYRHCTWPGNTYTHTTNSCLPYRCTVYTSGESTLVLSISNVAWVYSLGGNIRRPAVANGAWRFGLDTHDWTPATTTAAVSRFSIVSAFVPVTLYTLWLDLQLYIC